MYKGYTWDSGTFFGNKTWDGYSHTMTTSFNNNFETWSGYEVKYPDFGDGEPIEWKPLFDAITMSSYLTTDVNFTTNIANYYDLPVFLDYYLFIELMLATDNQGKNVFLSVYDQTVSPKMTISPWDCDGTWGRRWDGSSNLTAANQNFDTFITTNEHGQNNLFLRLKSLNYDGYSTKLKNRYQTLRGNYFSYSNLINRFQKYYDLFVKSGASTREQARWSIGNLGTEMTFLSTWITARLNYLDNQYLGGAYVPNALEDATMRNIMFTPNPVQNYLTVSNLTAGDNVQIVSIQGTVLIQAHSDGNDIVLDMSRFAPGVYLIKVGNNISKVIKN